MTLADKPLLILDLDETLVHATLASLPIPCDFMAGPYRVYKRPFVDQFFDTVQSAFHLAIWSSSSADYIAAIVETLIPAEFPLEFQWCRSRCVHRYHPERQEAYWVKDLKKVKRRGYDLRRVLIVDDSPEKLERSYGNAVYVRSFEGDPSDCELPLLGRYLTVLAGSADFRVIDKRGWWRA